MLKPRRLPVLMSDHCLGKVVSFLFGRFTISPLAMSIFLKLSRTYCFVNSTVEHQHLVRFSAGSNWPALPSLFPLKRETIWDQPPEQFPDISTSIFWLYNRKIPITFVFMFQRMQFPICIEMNICNYSNDAGYYLAPEYTYKVCWRTSALSNTLIRSWM